jgi:hypothetical protein
MSDRRLNHRLFCSWAHEQIARALALRAFFIAVISGRLAIRTLFPISVSDSAFVHAVAALSVNRPATTTISESAVVACTAALGAMCHGDFSLQHVQMIRPRWFVHHSRMEQSFVFAAWPDYGCVRGAASVRVATLV